MSPQQIIYNKSVNINMKNNKDISEINTNSVNNSGIVARHYVICSKCKAKKSTRKDRFLDLVKKYGSIENLDKNYLCRDCKTGGK